LLGLLISFIFICFYFKQNKFIFISQNFSSKFNHEINKGIKSAAAGAAATGLYFKNNSITLKAYESKKSKRNETTDKEM
jgi:hypothetical protein